MIYIIYILIESNLPAGSWYCRYLNIYILHLNINNLTYDICLDQIHWFCFVNLI